MTTRNRRPRPGMASVWALMVLTVVTALCVSALARMVSARRQVQTAGNRVQAEWLARAGYELAVGRLLAEADGYAGETAAPMADGEVKIGVRPDPAVKGVFRIECEARYPLSGRTVVARLERSVKRTDGPDGEIRVAPFRPVPPR